MRFKISQKQLSLFLSAVATASIIVSIAVVHTLDTLVHGLLYEYGLVFDYGWASPYWTTVRTLFVLLTSLFIISVIPIAAYLKAFLGLLFGNRRLQASPTRRLSQSPAPQVQPIATSESPTPAPKPASAIPSSTVPMICSRCGKVFNQALSMFDFQTGVPRLTHVCPYCSAVLAVDGSPTEK
jgi:hypothetical protein